MTEDIKKKITGFLEDEDYENFILLITNLEIDDFNYKRLLDEIGVILHNKKFAQQIKPSDSKIEIEKIISGKEDEDYLSMHQNLKEAIVKIFKIKLNTDTSQTFEDDEKNDLINDYLDRFEGDFNI